MAKIWDILPPQKTTRKLKPQEKRERRANISWLFFLAVLTAFFIVFFGASKIPFSNESSPDKTSSPVISSPKLTLRPSNKTQTDITIKLLNGTGRVEETQKVRDLLKNAGFKLTVTENALNLYDQTLIYFQPAYENYANDLATVLKSYNAQTQKFTQDTPYDIVIVIGTK